jgi:regulator of sigma E protease
MSDKERETKVDVLIAAGPEGESPARLPDIAAYERLLSRAADRPIRHVIERRLVSAAETDPPLERFEITFAPNRFIDIGVRLKIEPISAIRKDSPADKAGFRKGDLIIKVDGRDDFDPVDLPRLCYRSARKRMTFDVERKAAGGATTVESLTVIPDDTPSSSDLIVRNEQFDVPSLGLCFAVAPRVAAVRPGSPAAKAGLKPRDVINAITFRAGKSSATGDHGRSLRATQRARTIDLDERSPGWNGAFAELQIRPLEEVELVVNKASSPVRVLPEPDPDPERVNPVRGLLFEPLFRKRPPEPFLTALASGFRETIDNMGQVYATIRSLVGRRVGLKNLGGPIMIAQVAYTAAGSSFQDFMNFLGFLSVNLAVLNFLPIPPLDGGQMVYLLAEKVRGRPLPDSAMIAGIYVGFLLLVCLMVFVTYQDLLRLVNAWF